MKKRKIDGKKLIIIVLLIILLLLAITAIYIVINEKSNSQTINDSSKQTNKITLEEKAENLLYNVFLISYILEGDVKIGDGILNIDDDSDVYYAVTDALLEDIHSIEDINRLIENNLLPLAAARTQKIMESSYANQYTYSNNTLYVKKKEEPCEVIPSGLVEKEKAEHRYQDNNAYIIYKNVPYQYYLDNNEVKAGALWFTCVNDFSNIGIGKDDIYEHDHKE